MGTKAMTGMAAVYYVAAELSLRGCITTVTARNAPGVDILANSGDGTRSVMIQVKGNRPGGTRGFWLLSKAAKEAVSRNLFYVFVNLRSGGERPDFYVVRSRDVAGKMSTQKARTGSIWYSFTRDDKDRDAWYRLGLFDDEED